MFSATALKTYTYTGNTVSFYIEELVLSINLFLTFLSKIGMLMTSLCFVCEPPYEDNFNLRLPTDLILICSRQLLTTPGLTKTKSESNQAFSKSRRDRGENHLVPRSLETRKLKD